MFSRLSTLREIAASEIGWQTSQRVFDVARRIETYYDQGNGRWQMISYE